jgi:predicted Zn-dependent protease
VITALTVAFIEGPTSAAQRNNSDFDNIGTRNINQDTPNFISLDTEVAVSRQVAAEIERTVPLITDPTIAEYINRVGQTVVRNSDAKGLQFSIRVIDSEELNAFALPGGFVFVPRGLILVLDDESELAGVMAHQVAHVAARHSTEQASSQQSFTATSLSAMPFSREMEEEADYLGVQYLHRSGYDPNGMVRLLQILQGKGGTSLPWHPFSGYGSRNVEEAITSILPAQPYVEDKSELDRIKALLASEDRQPPVETLEIPPVQVEPPTLKRKGVN